MKKNILLLILLAFAAPACQSELTTVTPGNFDTDIKADVSNDSGPEEDTSSKVDLGPTKDLGQMDMAKDQSPDVEVDQNDGGMTIKGSAGCGVGEGIPEGVNSFTIQDQDRNFVMRLPEGYTNEKAWPVVLALHGNGGNSDYWDAESGDRNIRGVLKNEAILIVANAFNNLWRYHQDRDDDEQLEVDLLYFDEILTQVKTKMCVNEDAIFSMGFSGGGSYSGVLGCRRDDIRAIAVGGSVIYFKPEDCIGTPAAWITIGAQEQATGRTNYLNFFRERAGCEATSTATDPDPCQLYDNCDEGTPVHYCEHPAAGHVWPALGTQAMWEFFKPYTVE